MSAPSNHSLAELLVRYWDDSLVPAEAEELERRLAANPPAGEWFQMFALQVVAAAGLRGQGPAAGRSVNAAGNEMPGQHGGPERLVAGAAGPNASKTAAPAGGPPSLRRVLG